MSIELIIAGCVILMVVISVAVLRGSRRGISSHDRNVLEKEWKHAESIADPVRRVLEAEKVLDHAFTLRGHTGTFADKLKVAEGSIPQYQQVWDAHKLRNRLAHEPGFTVTDKQAANALRQFKSALHALW